MTEKTAILGAETGRLSYLWLGVAMLLTWFTTPEWTVPLAAWLTPLFLLRFTRSLGPLRGFFIAWAVSLAVVLVALRGVYPQGGAEYVVTMVVGALLGTLPFLVDRLVSPRLGAFASTLVLPVAATALDFLGSFASNVGAFASAANTQVGNLPLMQIVSVAGIWPVTFLLFWLAPVANLVWERGLGELGTRRSAAVYAAVLATVLLLGGARLLSAPSSDTVRTASIALDTLAIGEAAYAAEHGRRIELGETVDQSAPEVREAVAALNAFYEDPDAPRYAPVREEIEAINDRLFALSEREARAGARIVAWAEANATVLGEDEDAFVERGRRLAREENVYLFMSMWVRSPGDPRPENKVVAVTPEGEVAFTYLKNRLAPGETAVAGDGRIPTIETPYGKLTTTICWDLDFPALVRQAGREGVDVMVSPSADWEDITPWHARVAAVRGIENGFSLVRPVRNGQLLATDWQGNVSGQLSYFDAAEDPVLVADVPTRGATTLYPRLGDAFAWGCVAGTLIVAAVALAKRVRTGRNDDGEILKG